MILALSGGRNYCFTSFSEEYFLQIYNVVSATKVVVGDCKTGLDPAIVDCCKKYCIPYEVYKADWDKYGKAAGPKRNLEMAKVAHVLLAYPGGRGTRSMLEHMISLKKPYIVAIV